MSEDKYPRVTKAQFDIWLDNPVTKAYLQCLEWSAEQMQEMTGNGSLIDIESNDKSMNQIHCALGEKAGLIRAANPGVSLDTHQMLEEEDSK